MKNEKYYLSIGHKKVKGKHHCDGCGVYGEVLEYGGMTESGYESDYIYCVRCLKLKYPEIK